MRARGFTLIELLCVIVIIGILAALWLGPIAKARQWCKEWAYGAYAYKENQITVFLDDNAPESRMLRCTTNRPVRWSFVDSSKLTSP